eukprot:GILI01033145.1.p1 GENE.GILI01033145.1~~GILI01033145.1.p1  ORF type:complete len:125 (+),score=17.56 GILI01033145.1:504-878(+)
MMNSCGRAQLTTPSGQSRRTHAASAALLEVRKPVAISVLNIESMLRLKAADKVSVYKPIAELSPEELAELEKKFEEHAAQTSRYPKEKYVKPEAPRPKRQREETPTQTIEAMFARQSQSQSQRQ